MAQDTPMKRFRLALGKNQNECAKELGALTKTRANQSRWSALELDKIRLAQADYMTVFYIAEVLQCETWELVPRATRRLAYLARKAAK